MKYKLPNANDRAIVSAVDKAIAQMKKRGDWPTQKKGSLTDKSGKEERK